ncbi:helix-turn-helix domain-containing protein [Streptomyces sp. NPDC102279]|uniref:helix-turn-helix domain-containing protein n=1 Tax=Streptomyces sp. NPDC102279 TaxID=3366153 RepID=UPI003810AD82
MTPSPEHARLAAELRALRERTGLSLSGLAAKTAYSRSSWERYLNGRTLPPRQAVRELCQLAGEPEGRVLALWEITESGWSGRAKEAPRAATARPSETTSKPQTSLKPQTAPKPETAPRPSVPSPTPVSAHVASPADRLSTRQSSSPSSRRTVTLMAVLAAVCALAVGGVTVVLLVVTRDHGDARRSATQPSSAASSSTHPNCRGAACEGLSPMVTRCGAQPETLARRRMSTGAWMEVRYNRWCGASWARTWGARVGDRIEMSADGAGSPVRRAKIKDDVDTDSFVYTPMTATLPGTVVRACFLPAANDRKECFDSRVTQ